MTRKDSLGDRIKRYEHVSSPTLISNTPVFIRVDGKAFHTWTRGLHRPFDFNLIGAMGEAARCTADEMMGFKLAYIQSDEATFMLTDYDTHQTEPWFGYELNKLVSVTASLFTAHFNREVAGWKRAPAVFDARAFNVPIDDAPNVFVWRQRDWERNSLQMLARSHFSHKELNGKRRSDMHDMLHAIGVNWADLNPRLKNGTWIHRDGSVSFDRADYAMIDHWIAI